MAGDSVEDARPPQALIRVLNPLMRALLPTPVGGLIRPVALLEFTGRLTHRRYRVPVGWYECEGMPVVVTPARWRRNFAGGLAATVCHSGQHLSMVGTLVDDPPEVARVLSAMVDGGLSLGRIGIRAPNKHRLSPDEVVILDRALIQFCRV